MIDWDHDGDVDVEDIGLSAMLLDDLSSDEQRRDKHKKGCLGGCLGTAVIGLVLAGTIGLIIAMCL